MLQPPPPAVAALPQAGATSFRNVGWLVGNPDDSAASYRLGPGWVYNATPQLTPQDPTSQLRAYKVPYRNTFVYSDPPDVPIGLTLWRRQAIVLKTPTQYGSDAFALGHYAPFHAGVPIRSVAPFVESSGFQPLSRGGKLLVSITESNREGGPGAAGRRFANTRFGLWFKAWVIGGSTIRPLGSVQTPSPQFRGVLPNYGYMTLPQIIGQ
jgi:hypothetical protein